MARRLAVSVAALVLWSAFAIGQKVGAREEVAAMWEAWFQARKDGDRAALENMMVPEFTSTHANAQVRSREEYIDLWTRPRAESEARLDRFDLTDTTIRLYGDTAVVTGGVTSFHHYLNGERFTIPRLVTATLVKNAGRWQAVALHISRIPQNK